MEDLLQESGKRSTLWQELSFILHSQKKKMLVRSLSVIWVQFSYNYCAVVMQDESKYAQRNGFDLTKMPTLVWFSIHFKFNLSSKKGYVSHAFSSHWHIFTIINDFEWRLWQKHLLLSASGHGKQWGLTLSHIGSPHEHNKHTQRRAWCESTLTILGKTPFTNHSHRENDTSLFYWAWKGLSEDWRRGVSNALDSFCQKLRDAKKALWPLGWNVLPVKPSI